MKRRQGVPVHQDPVQLLADLFPVGLKIRGPGEYGIFEYRRVSDQRLRGYEPVGLVQGTTADLLHPAAALVLQFVDT